jgi:hypothetical protein
MGRRGGKRLPSLVRNCLPLELAAQQSVEAGKLRVRANRETPRMPPTSSMTSPFVILTALIGASLVAGCASERLDKAAPPGVNLSGEWRFNVNLSDDADKLGEKDETPTKTPSSGGHRGHGGGRGGGGGMPPVGTPPDGPPNFTGSTDPMNFTGSTDNGGYEFQRVALALPGIEQSTQLPPSSGAAPGSASNTRGATISRFLKAPVTMSIVQKDGVVSIHAVMSDGTTTSDDFPVGTQTGLPYGKDQTMDREVGWRGPAFVVSIQVKKGGFREDDFAVDDDGRLIMTTLTKGGRFGKVEIKRVYDRIKAAN